MRKICVVTGNRAEYSRLKSVMRAIQKSKKLELILIVTASHLMDDYDKTINIIKQDGFKVTATARTIAAGSDLSSMAKSAGLCALEMPTLFEIFKPDIILIVGDRFDAIGVAVAASLMNIPIAHIQGGEITGTIDESLRHAITKLSHIHFPATKKSAERIIKIGERKEHVFNVGCPSVDIMLEKNLDSKEKICKKYKLDSEKPFLICLQHPITTEYGKAGNQIRETLFAISELGIQTLIMFPNVDAGSKDMIAEIRHFTIDGKLQNTTQWKHIKFEDFVKLLSYSSCIVGNSSSGIRESCYFGTPTVNIGTRQDGRERNENIIDVGHDRKAIKNAILESIKHGKYDKSYIYGKGNSGEKITKILETINLNKIIQKKIQI